MIAQSDRYVDWDAAYVLGALSPDDRRDFERHLGECDACSRAVAELAGIPGLLATVPAEQVLSDGDLPAAGSEDGAVPMPMPGTTLPALLAAARRDRWRYRGLAAAALVGVAAAAATVALAVTGWPGLPGSAPAAAPSSTAPAATPPASAPATTLVMAQVVPSPLSADVRLEARPWGTAIVTRCSYAQVDGPSGARGYALYVTDMEGVASLVATWAAGPGSTVTPVGTTSLAEADIRAVDIRSLSGLVLLEALFEP